MGIMIERQSYGPAINNGTLHSKDLANIIRELFVWSKQDPRPAKIVKAIFGYITELLLRGDRITIEGIGTFRTRPCTRYSINEKKLKTYTVARFTPSYTFRKLVQKGIENDATQS